MVTLTPHENPFNGGVDYDIIVDGENKGDFCWAPNDVRWEGHIGWRFEPADTLDEIKEICERVFPGQEVVIEG